MVLLVEWCWVSNLPSVQCVERGKALKFANAFNHANELKATMHLQL